MSATEPETRPMEAARPEPAPQRLAEPTVAPGCPRCGTPLRPGQEWCLNCGAAATTRVASPAGWRTPLVIVGAVLALALAGLVVGFLALSDDSDDISRIAQQQQTATQTPSAIPPAATPAPTTTPPTPTPTPAATIPPATGGTQPPAGGSDAGPDPGSSTGGATSTVGTWPAGRSAFTVVLLSSTTRKGAKRKADQLAGEGTDVGILESGDYKSLNPGYFVVFSGQYDSRQAAESALGSLGSKAPGAYVRRVTPR